MKLKTACMRKRRCWNFSCAKNHVRINFSRAGSTPIAIFRPSPAVGRIGSLPVAPFPSFLAVVIRPIIEIQVKKILSSFFILLVTFASAQAEVVYVTDNLNLSLRTEENNSSKVVKLIPTGTPLTIIEENKSTGFAHVRMNDGTEGYMPIRNTMKEPPSRAQLEIVNKNMAALQSENATLKAELATVKESITPGTTLEQSLATERDQLNRELNELKKTAASTIELKNQRDELQERVVNVERELQQFKLENQALQDTANQDWFLYGGILALIGVVLGFILPKLSWRRSRSSWDSY
jgi:SH3 domain protein